MSHKAHKRIFSDRDPLFYWLYALGNVGAGSSLVFITIPLNCNPPKKQPDQKHQPQESSRTFSGLTLLVARSDWAIPLNLGSNAPLTLARIELRCHDYALGTG